MKTQDICSRSQQKLVEVEDGKLPLDLRQHVASCPDCKNYWELQQQIKRLSRPAPAVPDSIRINLHKSLTQSKPANSVTRSNRLRSTPRRAALAFAFSILLIALIARPYLQTVPKNQGDYRLFEQQDSLLMHTLLYTKRQNPGIPLSRDTLLQSYVQRFP